MNNERKILFRFENIVLILVTSILFMLVYVIRYTNDKDRTIHIKSATNITGNKVKYLIFAKEGVFENTDRFFIFKFNSSDIRNELLGKKVCKVHTKGYRIPFLSEYPDITKIYWCK
jgi:hypothetical protein